MKVFVRKLPPPLTLAGRWEVIPRHPLSRSEFLVERQVFHNRHEARLYASIRNSSSSLKDALNAYAATT